MPEDKPEDKSPEKEEGWEFKIAASKEPAKRIQDISASVRKVNTKISEWNELAGEKLEENLYSLYSELRADLCKKVRKIAEQNPFPNMYSLGADFDMKENLEKKTETNPKYPIADVRCSRVSVFEDEPLVALLNILPKYCKKRNSPSGIQTLRAIWHNIALLEEADSIDSIIKDKNAWKTKSEEVISPEEKTRKKDRYFGSAYYDEVVISDAKRGDPKSFQKAMLQWREKIIKKAMADKWNEEGLTDGSHSVEDYCFDPDSFRFYEESASKGGGKKEEYTLRASVSLKRKNPLLHVIDSISSFDQEHFGSKLDDEKKVYHKKNIWLNFPWADRILFHNINKNKDKQLVMGSGLSMLEGECSEIIKRARIANEEEIAEIAETINHNINYEYEHANDQPEVEELALETAKMLAKIKTLTFEGVADAYLHTFEYVFGAAEPYKVRKAREGIECARQRREERIRPYLSSLEEDNAIYFPTETNDFFEAVKATQRKIDILKKLEIAEKGSYLKARAPEFNTLLDSVARKKSLNDVLKYEMAVVNILNSLDIKEEQALEKKIMEHGSADKLAEHYVKPVLEEYKSAARAGQTTQ